MHINRKYDELLIVYERLRKPYDFFLDLLNQNFSVDQPNKVWVADITYIPCREGRMYLASILDLCTKEIVGWNIADRMSTDLVIEALEAAYEKTR